LKNVLKTRFVAINKVAIGDKSDVAVLFLLSLTCVSSHPGDLRDYSYREAIGYEKKTTLTPGVMLHAIR